MKRLLITGATGYLGQHLVAHFSQQKDVEIYALVRPLSDVSNIKSMATCCVYDGSFASISDIFAKRPIDVVIHIASLATYQTSAENITSLIEANLQLGVFLLQAMAMHNCTRLINTGSYSQHNETKAYSPASLYSAMKEAFEKIIFYYTQAKGFKVITLKLTDLYGPSDPRKKLFQLLSNAAKTQLPLEMTGCEQHINLIYIDDAVNAYVKAAEKLLAADSATSFHDNCFVAAEKEHQLKDVINLYASKNPVNVVFGKKPYRESEIMHPFIGDRLSGWKAQVSLEDGINNLLKETKGSLE